jgi:hypothetical protein
MAKEWYLTSNTNDYFSGYENDEFAQYGQDAFEEMMSASPEVYPLIINENSHITAIVQSTEDHQEMKVLFRDGQIEYGDLVKFRDLDWLIIERPLNVKMNSSSKMKVCNNLFPIKQDEMRVLLRDADGNPILDGRGRPQYTTEIVLVTAPCIVESRYSFTRGEQQIALAEDRIEVIVGYVESENLKLDFEFKMYGDTYKVKNIDYSNVINGEGILIISAERKV